MTRSFVVALAAACCLAPSARGQNLIVNGDFESGFPAVPDLPVGIYGTPSELVDTDLRVPGVYIDVLTPNGQWVNSAGGGAAGSDHFLWLSTGGMCAEYRNDYFTSPMLAGQRYQLCYWAATGAGAGQALNVSGLTNWAGGWHRILDGDGRILFTDANANGTVDGIAETNLLPANPAWIDGTSTAIPWVEYCFEFTAPTVVDGVTYAVGTALPGTVGFDISIDNFDGFTSAAMVLDGVRLVAVPEPGALGLAAGAAAAFAVWRRRVTNRAAPATRP